MKLLLLSSVFLPLIEYVFCLEFKLVIQFKQKIVLEIQLVIQSKAINTIQKHLQILLNSLVILLVIQLKLYYQAKSISSCSRDAFGNTI